MRESRKGLLMHILAIAAHPDDETCAGGLLAKYADEGHTVGILFTTRGEGAGLGDPPVCARAELGSIREQEARAAGKILGAQQVLFLPFIDPVYDGQIHAIDTTLEQFSQALQEVFAQFKPDVVITHGTDGEYGHPQHIFTQQAVFHALRQMNAHPAKLLTWHASHPQVHLEGDTNLSDPADLLVDIRPWAERKLRSLQAHRTQFPSLAQNALEANTPIIGLEFEAYRTWQI